MPTSVTMPMVIGHADHRGDVRIRRRDRHPVTTADADTREVAPLTPQGATRKCTDGHALRWRPPVSGRSEIASDEAARQHTHPTSLTMWLPLLLGMSVMSLGLWFSVTGTEICRYGCWLERMLDFLLPSWLESASGGVPWLLIGAGIVASALRRRR